MIQLTLKERGSLVRADGQEQLVVLDGEVDEYSRDFNKPPPGHLQCCGVDDSHIHSRGGRGSCRGAVGWKEIAATPTLRGGKENCLVWQV